MSFQALRVPFLLAVSLFAASPAFAQEEGEEDDEALDDILNDGSGTQTAKEERQDVEAEDTDDRPGVTSDSTALPEERTRRVIKTLQRKTFLKIGRYEASPHVGFVTNDPFINRYMVGAAFAYHPTEIFAIEAIGSFSPDFGRGDWKAITEQLVDENKVSPDISKIQWYGNINFQFSPIYGKVAVSDRRIINFDVFGSFGTGVVSTRDDLEALQACGDEGCDPDALATELQYHPTTNFGAGIRVIFSENLAARLEGRSLTYIETISSTTLEMKNNFMLLASASFFFPGME
jgi:outer membrane beta-barrel protein